MWEKFERKCKLCGWLYKVDGNQDSTQDSVCPTCEKFLKPLAECFVPVIRCKNCKHKGRVQEPCHGKSVDYCKVWDCTLRNLETTFCSNGERKDNENE